jgi:prepilin-type N-terminal cleavage/methylation domain-containing protein
MTQSPAPRTRRAGFTLVEVLVVIGIITLLVALTASAVFKVIAKGDEVIARKDMSDLVLAIENFKISMGGVGYIPSRFRLRENLADYQTGIKLGDQLDIDSWAYLKKLFPQLKGKPFSAAIPNWVDWNNNGTVDPAVDLEGHQCLVFFLGGIPSYNPNNCIGFSTVPSDPSAQTSDRIGPFYGDFKSNRLIVLPTGPVGALTGVPPASANLFYFSYMDPWAKESDFNQGNLIAGKTPVYAYFSAYGKTNGYNRYFNYYLSLVPPAQDADGLGPVSDCASLVTEDYQKITPTFTPKLGLWPYALKTGASVQLAQYVNSTSYQIFTAGPNKVFGEGTRLLKTGAVYGYTWSQQTAGLVSPLGKDDFSNFHDRQLGSGD